MSLFASSKKKNSECVSIVGSQENTIDRGSPSDATMDCEHLSASSQNQCENHFRDAEDENLTQTSSIERDTWVSEHDEDDDNNNEESKWRSNMNRRARIVEEPELAFESIDSSNWPRSWSGTSLSKTGEYSNRLRWYKVIVIVTLMIGLSALLGVVVRNKKEATTSQSENLRTSSVVTQSPPSNSSNNNIFDEEEIDEEETDEESTNNSTANATEPFDEFETAGCMDMIRTDQRCYTRKDLRNDELTIGFVRCEPHLENWVGIYDAGLNAESLPEPLLWLWTCDKMDILDCNEIGTVSGALGVSGMLELGFYQAHLVERDGNAPYSAFLSSEVFQVGQDCSM